MRLISFLTGRNLRATDFHLGGSSLLVAKQTFLSSDLLLLIRGQRHARWEDGLFSRHLDKNADTRLRNQYQRIQYAPVIADFKNFLDAFILQEGADMSCPLQIYSSMAPRRARVSAKSNASPVLP